MRDPLRDRLLEAARRVRSALEDPSVTHPAFPRLSCQAASRVLAKYLVEVEGIGPVEGIANGERAAPSGGPEPPTQDHFWLECGGYVIDITADQFDDFAGGPVVVTQDRSWHGQFAGQKRLPQEEAVRLNDYLLGQYTRMLRKLEERDDEPPA